MKLGARRRALAGVTAGLCASWLIAACGSDDAEDAGEESSRMVGAFDLEDSTCEISIAEQGVASIASGLLPRIAHELGFLDEAGVTVREYIAVGNGADAINGLQGGSVQFALIGPEGMGAVAKGLDLVSVAAGVDTSPWVVVGGPEVKTWDDLKGKRIGLGSLTDASMVAWTQLAENAGFDAKSDFTYVASGATPDRLTALDSGQIDATIAAHPYAAQFVDLKGFNNLGFTPDGGEPPAMIAADIVSKRSWALDNKQCVAQFLRAMLQAVTFIKDPGNRDQTIAISSKLTEVDPKYIATMVDSYLLDPEVAKRFYPVGLRSEDGLVERTSELYAQIGVVEGSVSEDEYRDYGYLDAASSAP